MFTFNIVRSDGTVWATVRVTSAATVTAASRVLGVDAALIVLV